MSNIQNEFIAMSNEKDWKLFRKRLPEWQERHMQTLLDEYAAIIVANENPSSRFWKLEERLRKDVRHVGVSTTMKRSTMRMNLRELFREKAITMEDLDGFSDDLKRYISFFCQRT